jgi:hypothetical protein
MAMTSEVKLGKPKYEGSKKNYFAFKKDQNTFILRILPPMGDLAEKGKWSVYHRVEFGYKGTDDRMFPFLSPRVINFNTKMVEVESEAHRRREQIKTQAAQAKDAGNTALEEQCKTMLRKYNQDSKHYMNVVDLQGNVGLFKIGHKGFLALNAAIDKLRGEGVDPIGVENGRYFVFSRTGRGLDTLFTVTEYKQKQEIDNNGQKLVVDAPFPHSINESIMNKLATDAFELDKVYPTVTPEEEHRIVHGGPEGVDEVKKAKKGGSTQDNPASTGQAQTTTQTSSVASEASSETSSVTPSAEASEAASIQETSTQETPAAEATPAPTPETIQQPAASAAGGPVSDMSEEEFFAKMESGNF